MIGKFDAKIKDYGVSKTQAGNPQLFITFTFEAEGATKELTWYGSFVGGAKDITLKSLINCGLTPDKFSKLNLFNTGIQSGLLNLGKVLSIDVQEEPHQNDPTKTRTVVRWVNDPESSYVVKRLSEAENAQMMSGINFEGDLHRLFNEAGGNLGNKQGQTQGQNQTNMGQNFNNGQTQGQNFNQNNGQNQNQNFNQNQNQNYQNGNNNQTHMNGNGNNGQQNFQNNFNQNQNNQGQNGNYKAPF